MTNFKAGDKVVCVDASDNPRLGKSQLKQGSIYLVEGIGDAIYDSCSLFLVGLKAKWQDDGLGFAQRRFRKLITRTERERMEVERKMPLTIKEAVERGLLAPIKPVEIKLQ